jgi:hypothetical protein
MSYDEHDNDVVVKSVVQYNKSESQNAIGNFICVYECMYIHVYIDIDIDTLS